MCVQYGLHKGCSEMKNKYLSVYESVAPMYIYRNALNQAQNWFKALVVVEFVFLKDLKEGKVGVTELKLLVQARES